MRGVFYKLGRVMQLIGMILLPLAIAGNLSPEHTLSLKESLLLSGTGVKVWTAFDKEPKVVPLEGARTLAWSPDGSGLFGTSAVAVRWYPFLNKQTPRDIDAAADGTVQLAPGRPLPGRPATRHSVFGCPRTGRIPLTKHLAADQWR